VPAALTAAATDFADILIVYEEALISGRRSGSNRASGVYRALAAIAEVGRMYFEARQAGKPMGPVDEALRSRIPFKYTPRESTTTLGLFGQTRVFHHQGKGRQMLRHLTLARGDHKNCLQIYFEFDEESQRVEVGYCGRHLPIARQPT
jgi:hypothetical protein